MKKTLLTKKKLTIILVVACILSMVLLRLWGGWDQSLPENSIAFEAYEYEHSFPQPKNISCWAIDYNNRTYIGYGGLKGIGLNNEYGKCIGYIVDQEYHEEKDNRIFTLVDDADNNFLVEYYVSGFMEPAIVYRAVDTKDKDIKIPRCVDSHGFDFWK